MSNTASKEYDIIDAVAVVVMAAVMVVVLAVGISHARQERKVKWRYVGKFLCSRYADQGLTNRKWDDGFTATMTKVRYGVCAVDPKVIPLGSKVKVEGFKVVFSAEDTGRLIKGKRLDIWHEDRAYCMRWGIQYRKIYVRERK